MVGHHAPLVQIVSCPVEEKERLLNRGGDLRLTQPAGPMPGIQVGLEALFAFRITHHGWHRLKFSGHLLNDRSGKTVDQVEADMLDVVLALEVWKETAIPPNGVTGLSSGPSQTAVFVISHR